MRGNAAMLEFGAYMAREMCRIERILQATPPQGHSLHILVPKQSLPALIMAVRFSQISGWEGVAADCLSAFHQSNALKMVIPEDDRETLLDAIHHGSHQFMGRYYPSSETRH